PARLAAASTVVAPTWPTSAATAVVVASDRNGSSSGAATTCTASTYLASSSAAARGSAPSTAACTGPPRARAALTNSSAFFGSRPPLGKVTIRFMRGLLVALPSRRRGRGSQDLGFFVQQARDFPRRVGRVAVEHPPPPLAGLDLLRRDGGTRGGVAELAQAAFGEFLALRLHDVREGRVPGLVQPLLRGDNGGQRQVEPLVAVVGVVHHLDGAVLQLERRGPVGVRPAQRLGERRTQGGGIPVGLLAADEHQLRAFLSHQRRQHARLGDGVERGVGLDVHGAIGAESQGGPYCFL